MKRLKLAIEPRPISTWGITLANRLEWKEWNGIRQKVFRNVKYTCEICGAFGEHCHEVWAFDDRRKIQRLIGFQCVCKDCHDVKHFGRSSQVYSKRRQEELIKHWCKVNGLSEKDFKIHEAEIFTLNRKRADKQYIVKVGRRILT